MIYQQFFKTVCLVKLENFRFKNALSFTVMWSGKQDDSIHKL